MPTVTSCYQAHAQNADTRIRICGAALLVKVPMVELCRNLPVFNCIVHWKVLTLPTLHVVLRLH